MGLAAWAYRGLTGTLNWIFRGALNAIVFLYREVLVAPLGEISGLNRVQQRKRITEGALGWLSAC